MLRDRVAATSRIDDGLKPDCLQRLDAIEASRGELGRFMPSMEKFSTHEHRFGGRDTGDDMPELPEELRVEEAFLVASSEQPAVAADEDGEQTLLGGTGSASPVGQHSLAMAGSCFPASPHQRSRSTTALRGADGEEAPVELEDRSAWPWTREIARSPNLLAVSGAGVASGSQHRASVRSAAQLATKHGPSWQDVFWLEALPDAGAAASTTAISAASAAATSATSVPAEMRRARAHSMATRIRAPGAAADVAAAVAAVAAATKRSPGPVLLNATEAGRAHRQLQSSASTGSLGFSTLSQSATASGWRLRSLEKASLRGSLSVSPGVF